MKTTIKIESINHAIECIFYDNLEGKFEEKFGEIADGGSFKDFVKEKNITLKQLINFLNDYSDDHYEVA